MNNLKSFLNQKEKLNRTDTIMPVLFIGHGNPMNAIEKNEYTTAWSSIANNIRQPQAILCISAHWQTRGTQVTAMPKPKTIHDFSGFPPELFNIAYQAPGSPELAEETKKIIHKTNVKLDFSWGLDHGCWSILLPMFPNANIPVFQLSLDYSKSPQYHYELAQELQALRKRGVLIMGSGNIVHNLGMVQWSEKAYDWAIEFDEIIKKLIIDFNHSDIINYKALGKSAQLAIPTNEHFLPLLYTLALQRKNESVSFFAEKTTMGSISMRSLKIS